MHILDKKITRNDLNQMTANYFGDLVKAVVDIDRSLIALDAELHADLESLLLDNDSKQEFLWGINFYPDMDAEDFVEFDSMINMRPSQGNVSRGVDDPVIQKKILEVVKKWVE